MKRSIVVVLVALVVFVGSASPALAGSAYQNARAVFAATDESDARGFLNIYHIRIAACWLMVGHVRGLEPRARYYVVLNSSGDWTAVASCRTNSRGGAWILARAVGVPPEYEQVYVTTELLGQILIAVENSPSFPDYGSLVFLGRRWPR